MAGSGYLLGGLDSGGIPLTKIVLLRLGRLAAPRALAELGLLWLRSAEEAYE